MGASWERHAMCESAFTQSLQTKYPGRSSTGTGRNSSGVVVTVDPISNIFKGKTFCLLRNVQTISGAQLPSFSVNAVVIYQGKCGRGVMLTTKLRLMLSLKMGGALHLLPLYAYMTWTEIIFTSTGPRVANHTELLTELNLSRIQRRIMTGFLISIFRRFLNVVCFLLGYSPASEFCVPTFRNTVRSS